MSSTTEHSAPDAKTSGHPTGIWVLCTTEMWERFAFYAMRAILVLYLVSASTSDATPGFGWTAASAARLYGIYTCLVYLIPLLGGWIADRYLGQFRSVLVGGSLMALGEFFLAATEFIRVGIGTNITMATDSTALFTFYTGLGLMILGNGFFKPCISVMVGQLYKPDETRKRDAGFSFFYMGINIGAFFSPLVAGTVAEKYGFHWGFLIAGCGMICGLITFWTLRRHLKGVGLPPERGPVDMAKLTEEEKIAREKIAYEQTRPLVKQDYDRMFVILILTLFVVGFWAAFEQAGSSLNLFAKNRTSRAVPVAVAENVPLIKGQLIQNEYRDDLETAVKEIEKTEKAIKEVFIPGEKKVVQETMSQRFWRLLSFRDTNEKKVSVEELLAQAEKRPFNDPIYNQNLLEMSVLLTEKPKADDNAENAAATPASKEKPENKLETLTGLLKDYPEKKQELDKRVGIASKRNADETSFTFPATWYQSANPLYIVIFAPLFIMLWSFLAKRGIEPSTPLKFAMGILLLSVGFFLMIPAAIEAKHGGAAAPYWLLLSYIFASWGELCLSPVGLSMVSKLAPARYASVFMGVWFLSSSVAYLTAGELAARFGHDGALTLCFGEAGGLADFFLLLGVAPAVIGIIALCMVPTLKKKMHGIR